MGKKRGKRKMRKKSGRRKKGGGSSAPAPILPVADVSLTSDVLPQSELGRKQESDLLGHKANTSKSPSTGPDPPEGQESQNGPNEELLEHQSIMANDHQSGELLSHSSLHSSNLEAPTNVPPAGNSASDATETYKPVASKSPSTGPDPPEGQEPENIAIAGPNGGDRPHEAADEINLITVPFKLQNGDKIELQLSPEETGMEVRQRLQDLLGNDIAFTSYALRVRDKKNDSVHHLEHNQTISNVVDISTGEFQLEMVPDHDRDVVGGENEEEQLSPPLVHDESHLARILHCVSNASIQQQDHRRPKLRHIRPRHQTLFEIGNRVISYWCQGLYRARVIGKDMFEGTLCRYYICYYYKIPKGQKQGKDREDNWNGFKRWPGWNQWVTGRRLLPVTEQNLDLMKETESKLSGKKGTEPGTWLVPPPDIEEIIDPIIEERRILDDTLGVHMPSSLYIRFVEQRDAALHLAEIVDVDVPYRWTARTIFNEFHHHHLRTHGNLNQLVRNTEILMEHFNTDISHITYETEKENEIDDQPAEVYGLDHLLRMLVKLPVGFHARLDASSVYLKSLFAFLEILLMDPEREHFAKDFAVWDDVGANHQDDEVDAEWEDYALWNDVGANLLTPEHQEGIEANADTDSNTSFAIQSQVKVKNADAAVEEGDQVIPGEPDVAVEEGDRVIPGEPDVAVEEGDRVIPDSMVVDESLPVTTVRISLLDNCGDRHRIRFNLAQTVGDIRHFIDTYVPGPPGMVYRLVAGGEPHGELQDNSETIEHAGLAGWGVIQRVL